MEFIAIFGTSNNQRTSFYPFSTTRLPTSNMVTIPDESANAFSLLANQMTLDFETCQILT